MTEVVDPLAGAPIDAASDPIEPTTDPTDTTADTGIDDAAANFAAPRGRRGGKGRKKGRGRKNCNKGINCGGTCISAKKKCKSENPTPAVKAKAKRGKASKSGGGGGGVTEEKKPAANNDGQATPTLKGVAYNGLADPNLEIGQFRAFLVDRERIQLQDQADWRSGSKSEQAKAARSAIGAGFAPSDQDIAGLKLTKSERSRLEENRAELDAKRSSVGKIQSAIDAPLLTDAEAKGYKPLMSQSEAASYTKGTFADGLDFYHGGAQKSIDGITTSGVKIEANTTGMYGRGFYLAAGKLDASSYADASAPAVLSSRIKTKNPYVMESGDLDKMNSWLDGANSAGQKSNANLSDFVKAKGHDSIYVKDLGYFVALDSRQVAAFQKEGLSKQVVADALAFGLDKRSNRDKTKDSRTGKVMADLPINTSGIIGFEGDDFDF